MFTPSRLATAKFDFASSKFRGWSKVAIIFESSRPVRRRLSGIDLVSPDTQSPSTIASSRKWKERTSAIHHALGVTNVIL
jgi:hypothetical protein